MGVQYRDICNMKTTMSKADLLHNFFLKVNAVACNLLSAYNVKL